jgi:glycine/D-amino acid oxidase-like deaminating enzyme
MASVTMMDYEMDVALADIARSKPASDHETIIIGAGIAGLACARQLHDSGTSFLLITEDIGGRVLKSTDGTVNLGAYYVRADYSHVNRFVERGRRIRRRHMLLGDEKGAFSRGDAPLLRHPWQALRFIRSLRKFRRHYEAFKQESHVKSQADAIRADPFLFELYMEDANEYVSRHRIEDIARSYLAPITQGTGFTSVDRLTAFTMLVGVLPTIIPIYEYVFGFDALTSGFGDSLLFGSVTGITPADDRYCIETADGASFSATNVVVATPTDVSARLLDLGPVKGPISAHMTVVRGSLLRPWSTAAFSLFPEGDPTCAIAQQSDGSILICSASEHVDLEQYFSSWEIVERHHWNPAFHLVGNVLLECEQGEGIYLIGDHNVCDLEDAYITGVYAANRILRSERVG